ncbi:MAG TPA: sulfatase [Chloroflexota bacterium]|nr:sulfatase [Chloroflexota bacterium]
MNLVVLVLDTLRYDCVHHTQAPGIARVQTPHLDALRRDGVSFSAVFGEAEPTIPVRRALWTGLRSFPWRFDYDTKGRWPNARGWHKIPPEHTTLSELLIEAGYKTCLIGDVYHIFKPTQNFTRGFFNWEFVRGQETDNWKGGALDLIRAEAERSIRGTLDPAKHASVVQYLLNKRHFKQEGELTGGIVLQRGVDWLKENHDDGPFMLWMESFDPHEPWDPPREYASRYYDFPKGKEGVEFIYPPEAARIGTDEEKERTKALYYGEITYMDHVIGRLLNTLADLGRLDDTIVMLTSDHGTELLDHGRFGKSPDHLYAHNTQLNWIVRDPRAPGGHGRTVDAFVQNHDIVPTALDLLGLLEKWPGATAVDRPDLAGRSAKTLIEGKDGATGREYVVTGWGNMASVRDGDWNYVVRFEDPSGTERLYDLQADPLEHKDVASEHADVVRASRRRLETLLGQELGTRLPDGPLDETMAPARAYYGSPRATRHEQASGFV